MRSYPDTHSFALVRGLLRALATVQYPQVLQVLRVLTRPYALHLAVPVHPADRGFFIGYLENRSGDSLREDDSYQYFTLQNLNPGQTGHTV